MISLEEKEPIIQPEPEPIEVTFKNIIGNADSYLLKTYLSEEDHRMFERMIKPHVASRISTHPIS